LLVSRSFRQDQRLNRCAVDHSAHVTLGTKGPFVNLIQRALCAIDNAQIDATEIKSQTYGATTAEAVLRYKTARAIINFSYQTKADNIVGIMTIKTLDRELAALEIASAGGDLLRPTGKFY
jgi:hypothetical protein